MCTNSTTSSIGLGAQLGGAILGAYGAYGKSTATQQAYEDQAAVEQNKAQVADMQASSVLNVGQQQRSPPASRRDSSKVRNARRSPRRAST